MLHPTRREGARDTHFMPIRRFLIVDDNADSRFLLSKTLLRKFPQAVLQECQDGEAAIAIAKSGEIDALVVHRATGIDGVSLVRDLRKVNANAPIMMVSGFDRTKEALAAGAT